MKVYNKLVRDKIETIMIENGANPVTRILTDEEYIKQLNIKLLEEINEYLDFYDVLELVDIKEVILAILNFRKQNLVNNNLRLIDVNGVNLNILLLEEANNYLKTNEIIHLMSIEKIISQILIDKEINYDEFENLRIDKVKKRGAFKNRLFLEKEL